MRNIFAERPDRSPGYLLSRVYAIRLKMMNESLSPLGVGYVQACLLMGLYWLQMKGEAVNQTMLINNTRLDKSVVSNLLRGMVRQGYVSRTECPSDTRSKIVALTPAGVRLTGRVAEIINGIDESFWGETPREGLCDFLSGVMALNDDKSESYVANG